ncbi:MAG: hypothetical protein LBU96_07225 [Yokenella regensburgei]|nr:hypothetical protein [Yokenella regensburgei]
MHFYRPFLFYFIAAVAVVGLIFLNYAVSLFPQKTDEIVRDNKILQYNGIWDSPSQRRIENLDGTFDVITLNFVRLKNIPTDMSFSGFATQWKTLPRGLDVPEAFYGNFTNKKQNGCVAWQVVVDAEPDTERLKKLHTDYIRTCGGWAGYRVETHYDFGHDRQYKLKQYQFIAFITDWQSELRYLLYIFMLPALWCLTWYLIGCSVRLATSAYRNGR